jgi:hypothetical protein
MVFDDLIYIRLCLFRSGFFCRALHLHRQDHLGYPGHDIYPPAIGWSIEFIIITMSPDQDLSNDYPEIEISACGDSAGEGRRIFMVAPNRDPLHNSSSRYPNIGRSETFDARTPNDGMIWNLNPDFNTIWLYTIIESIQRMAPEGSPLIALAQQGAEVVNVVVAQRSVGNPQGEPSIGN